jgi:hypothetical protein
MDDKSEELQASIGRISERLGVREQSFASPTDSTFDDFDCRQMLLEVCLSGKDDALRWSAARLETVLDARWSNQLEIPILTQLDCLDSSVRTCRSCPAA